MSDKVSQLLDVIKRQNAGLEQLIAERDKLRQEVDALVGWANGDQDALSCLQRLYSDPSASQANRIRAASAAIAFERSKPASVSAVIVDFGEQLKAARLKHLELQQAEWARKKTLDLEAPTSPTILGGPGPEAEDLSPDSAA
jgi:hypothetical protein